jgi:hypothetical protein
MTIRTTHKINLVKILTFEINVPKEGSQWSRYRKNVARNKIKNNSQNKNTNTHVNDRNEGKAELSNSVACVHTVERTWGVSSISFIAAVDRNGKTGNDFILTKIHCITVSYFFVFSFHIYFMCCMIFILKLCLD